MYLWRLLPTLFILISGCQRPDVIGVDSGEHEPLVDTAVPIDLASDLQVLARMTLDLLGRRPTLEEISLVEADPAQLETLAASYVVDGAFAPRMAWIWNDTLHTAVFGSSYYRFDGWPAEEWRAVGQEPLQVIEAVIADDLPFSEVVQSTQTRMDGVLAEVWGSDLDLDDGEWVWASYEDGRPMAGLLSSNALWLRYDADAVNYNRTRANTIARIFLCSDFLEREASFRFDIDAESLSSVETAVSTEPACLTCHAALDPLASFFGGFAERSAELPVDELVTYSYHNADWFSARRAGVSNLLF